MVVSFPSAETSRRIRRGQPGRSVRGPAVFLQDCSIRWFTTRRRYRRRGPESARIGRGGSLMLVQLAIAALLAFILSGPADAQVNVDIGIRLPAPPHLVVVPGIAAVSYAPAAPANFFFYGGQYWVFTQSGWHVSRRHDGPWVLVA